MSVHDCAVFAIDGTHASGKTTLVHALTAFYRAQGVHADAVGEPARTSPFVEAIVIHGQGQFDIIAEVDLFAAQITQQLRAARHHKLLIADKTILNVIAYARILMPVRPGSSDDTILTAMESFCQAWMHTYDAVFYLHDHYCPDQPGDPHRALVLSLQKKADEYLVELYARTGVPLIHVPGALALHERTAWIAERANELGLIRSSNTQAATTLKKEPKGC